MKKAIQQKQPSGAEQQQFTHGEKEQVRLNKYLSMSGYCSRRHADTLIAEQRVKIDGETAQTGTQVAAGQLVTVDDIPIQQAETHVYIALNKPAGITCTVETDVQGNLADFMNFERRIFPIGRLDKDSTGLILLTSDGDIVNRILRAENNNEKEYIVKVRSRLTDDFLQKMQQGVEITNMRNKTRTLTKKCRVKKLDDFTFSIVLTQGLNRQIRRMCTELGYRVAALRRVRIMHIRLADLKLGCWRYLTQQEMQALQKTIGG